MRLKTLEDEPVYLQVDLGGTINLLVIELGGEGARVLCRNCQGSFDSFHAGYSLCESILMLGKQGMLEVEPVIRWKNWPCIGVQFIALSDNDRAHIFKFLFELERKRIKRMNMEQ